MTGLVEVTSDIRVQRLRSASVDAARRLHVKSRRESWRGATGSFALAVFTGLLTPACLDDGVVECGVQSIEGGGVAAACAARWSRCDDGRVYGIYCERSGPGYSCACEVDLEVREQFTRDLCVENISVARRRCGWDIRLDDDDDTLP